MAKKLKILIADDSKLLRLKIRRELEALDCEVIEAENGKKAVEIVSNSNGLDCVFLDIVMPEMDGVKALEKIKELQPDLRAVMLSSAASPQKLMTTLKMGAMEFIPKPFQKEQIQKVIDTIRKQVEANG